MNTCEYLLERYPDDFVHAISTGATCDVRSRYDHFPLLDVMGGRIAMAATIYSVVQSFENLDAIREWSEQETKLKNWNIAAAQLAAKRKEIDREAEERALKRESRRDQPWRKRHA
jgi:hypothetical protein